MVRKNDLSAYKPTNHRTLREVPKTDALEAPKKGRTPTPAKEKRSSKVLLSLPEAERAAVEEKAGMVPVATYLVAKLRDAGVFD